VFKAKVREGKTIKKKKIIIEDIPEKKEEKVEEPA